MHISHLERTWGMSVSWPPWPNPHFRHDVLPDADCYHVARTSNAWWTSKDIVTPLPASCSGHDGLADTFSRAPVCVCPGLDVHSALPIYPPYCDQPPAPWWDTDADRSLLVGTYKHGYECYPAMRNDPTLGFLARCGPDVGSAMLMLANNTVTV